MWKTVVPAAAVLAAEAVIRQKINALPAGAFPLRVGPRVQLRRAHNRGLLCSRLAQKPRAATALQTASAAALAAVAAVCVCRRSGTALQIGMGLMLGGALPTSSNAGRAGRSRTMCTCRGRSSRFSGASSGTRPT